MQPDLADLLKELSALSDADRKAILKRLSSSERRALQKAKRDEHIHPNLRALSACSPKLVKQLAPIVQSDAGSRRLGVSEAARRALVDVLSAPKTAPNVGVDRDGWEPTP
jgi:hypothetical protein